MGKKARKQAKKKKREKRVQKRKRTQRGTAADEAPTQESDWGSLSPPYAGPNFDSERTSVEWGMPAVARSMG